MTTKTAKAEFQVTNWDEKPAVQVIREFLNDLQPGNPVLDAIRKAMA